LHGRLPRERYDEIEQEVIAMLEECGVKHYPIDPFELARKLRYILRPYSSLGEGKRRQALRKSNDGFSQVEEDPETGMNRYVIYYTDYQTNRGRLRWTILHEIAHCYLYHHCLRRYDRKEIEEEANHFAKYAIAPPPLVDAIGIQSASELEEFFITSRQAADHSFEFCSKWRCYKRHHPGLSQHEEWLLENLNTLSA